MAFVSSSFSNRKLQNRRYTTDKVLDTQEAYTSVLDVNASEVFSDVRYVPTSSAGIPFSGSSQSGFIVSASNLDTSITPGSADDLPILKYWYRHKLKPSNTGTGRDTYFFTTSEPSDSDTDTTGGTSLIVSDQLSNFISPKYISQNNAADSINDAEASQVEGSPGYVVRLFKSTNSDAATLSGANEISSTDYVFDYKTGVVSFNSAIATSYWVYASVYQYIGRTLGSQIADGTLGGSVDYGNEQTSADFSSSIAARATDLETASGSFSTRVTTNETDISTNQTNITNLQTDSGSFSTRVTANETNISTNQTNITNLQTDSASFSTRVTTNETDITNLQSDSGSFSTRVTTNETDISTNQSNITNLQTDSASFSTRVTTLEGTGTTQGVGQSDDVTFNSVTTTGDLDVGANLTVDGDLTVNGNLTSISTTNIDVKDAFVYLASGSTAANVDAGLFVQSGSADNSGSALYHDVGDQRWAVAKGMAQADTNLSANTNISRSYVVTTAAASGAPDETDVRYGYGEIYINSTNGDIYIRTTQD